MAVVVVTGRREPNEPGHAFLLMYVPMHLMQIGLLVVFRDWKTRSVRKVSLSSAGLYTLTFAVGDRVDREHDAYRNHPESEVRYEHGAALPCLVDSLSWDKLREKWLCPF